MSYLSLTKARSREHFQTCRFAILYLPEVLHLYRVEVTEDTKIPNAATVKVVKQDHTLANMVRGCVRSTLPLLPSSA